MGFGMNKKYFSVLLNPYLGYLYYKRKKYLNKYKDLSLRLGVGVSLNNIELGNHVCLGNNVSISNSSIGDHSYVNSGTKINRTEVGKFCSIGPNIKFGLGIHPTHLISTHPAFYSNNKPFKTFADKVYFKEYGRIKLGNDVWVGSDVIIMDNVDIGDGSIIAAGAIVTKDVKPYEVVGGIPAKHIKFRFDQIIIDQIEQKRWWDKDENWLQDNYKIFLDQKKFIEYFK